jgi:hypothetical protein
MTLVVAATTRESIWLAADRRLSYPGRVFKDDARKAMILETDDGVAILGYAGLGETVLGTEPADWMSAVLRGRRLSLEHSLQVLADACLKQIPQHVVRLAGRLIWQLRLIASGGFFATHVMLQNARWQPSQGHHEWQWLAAVRVF